MPEIADALRTATTTRGEDARAWLADHGWVVCDARTDLEIRAHELRIPGFAIGISTFSPMDAVRSDHQPGTAILSMTISGESEIAIDDRPPRALGRGAAVLADSGALLRVTSAAPVTALYVETSWRRLRALDRTARILATTNGGEFGIRRILLSLVASTLTTAGSISPAHTPHLHTAVDSLVSGVIEESDFIRPAAATSAERALLGRAIELIRANATDASFSTDDMSRTLLASKPYIQRAFRRVGTSPLRYLTALRAELALSSIDGRPVTSKAEFEAIAAASGFSSGRAMREAIRRAAEEL